MIAQVLKRRSPISSALRGQTLVIKLGGSTLDNQRDALEDIVWLRGLGAHPVLVHGGGARDQRVAGPAGLPHRFERGLRVTDAATLDVVRMVLAGKVNGELVRLWRAGWQRGWPYRAGWRPARAQPVAPDLGYVGAVDAVEPGPMTALSKAGSFR